MDYNYFENKYIEDLNKEELIWLSKNSYINSWVFNGGILKLNNKYKKSKLLIKKFPIIEKIEKLYYEFTQNISYATSQEIYKQMLNLYINIGNNFDEFISNINYIEEFINLYSIVIHIQQTTVKDFHNHNYMFLKDNVKYLYKDISYLNNAWRMWKYPCVRNIKLKDNKTHVNKNRIEYIMSSWEHGNLDKVLYLFEETDINYKNTPVLLSFIFYYLILLEKLNDVDKFNIVFKENIEKFKIQSMKNVNLKFKINDLYFLSYYNNLIDKQTLENEIYDNLKHYFKFCINRKDSFIFFNNYKITSYRHEHIGEIILNIKTYYNYLKYNKPFYCSK